MDVVAINHINITADEVVIERCRQFYVAVLGLTEGYRPPFASRGYWLYGGGAPLVHLTIAGEHAMEITPRSGAALDHVAFTCSGLESAERQFAEASVPFQVVEVPDGTHVQLFVIDPAGISLELQFVRAR
ncbi:MAG TPA: diguanylate cyclase [Thermoanaerobaculia bacterium]|jgi:catechol 2,3-dioxygenase-like lactoylglutathione lyase family enzyme